jgi:hypothetical protein
MHCIITLCDLAIIAKGHNPSLREISLKQVFIGKWKKCNNSGVAFFWYSIILWTLLQSAASLHDYHLKLEEFIQVQTFGNSYCSNIFTPNLGITQVHVHSIHAIEAVNAK